MYGLVAPQPCSYKQPLLNSVGHKDLHRRILAKEVIPVEERGGVRGGDGGGKKWYIHT